jgi:hypothetical protein
MKLISCDHCSVVLDHDKMGFARDLYGEDDTIDESKAKYDQYTKEYRVYALAQSAALTSLRRIDKP